MDQGSGIRLNPDVSEPEMLEGKEAGQTPLSDLYGYPVFGADTEQRAGECRRKERQMLEKLRQEVFAAEGQETKERLGEIRSQIFREKPQQEAFVLAESGRRETEASAPEIRMLSGLTAAGLLLIFLVKGSICRRKKEMREQSNDADIDSRQQTTGYYGEA